MKSSKHNDHWLLACVGLMVSLSLSAALSAIEPDKVRRFEEVFVISGHAPDRAHVEVTWDIAPGYFLYNNRFLKFSTQTAGVQIGEAQIPRGEVSFDPLLGEEVEKYHDRLTVTLPLLEVDPRLDGLRINVRSQGCLENVLCYPPTDQVLLVGLPPTAAGGAETADAPPVPPVPEAGNEKDGGLSAADGSLAVTPGGGGDNPLAELGLTPSPDEPLSADSAFLYEAIGLNAETILVRFTAQPGYYLYRDKFVFRVADASGFSVRAADLPNGVVKDDPEFGSVAVIYGQVEIPVKINRPAGPVTTISLQADFQGCRDGEICYPPQSRIVSLEMPAAAAPIGAGVTASGNAASARPVSEQDRLAQLLTQHAGRAVLAFFLAGMLLAFTPCVFPMVPILSGIILGQGKQLTTGRAFGLSVIYVLAMAATYTAAGVLAGLFGQNLQAAFQNPWILGAFALIFVVLALSMFGLYELQLPSRLQTRLAAASNQRRGGSSWGVAVMGFLSALIVGPCVAPPLMAALIVIGASGDAVLGGSALFALSLGMGVPLILFGVSAGKLVPRAGAWMGAVKAVFGVGLLALAIWILERILPGVIIMLLWGMLAIACGVYLGALDRVERDAPGWRPLWKALGVVLLLAGALELVGAAAGGSDWQRPLNSLRVGIFSESAAERATFHRVKSLEDLHQAVREANQQSKGAMLDFYADWCVECLRMERNTFHQPEVQALLQQMRPLQADVTVNDTIDRALMRAYGIIGPPAILFFDRKGEEMRDWRLVGYFTPAEFSAHLSKVLAAQ